MSKSFLTDKPKRVMQTYYCSDCGSRVKPKKCSCGKRPEVKASGGLFPQHYVECECGERSYQCREYPDGAILLWNQMGHFKPEAAG